MSSLALALHCPTAQSEREAGSLPRGGSRTAQQTHWSVPPPGWSWRSSQPSFRDRKWAVVPPPHPLTFLPAYGKGSYRFLVILQASLQSPGHPSAASGPAQSTWGRTAGSVCSWHAPHLEMGVSVTLSNLLQQLPAGLPHRASRLQQVLPGLEGRKQGSRQHSALGLATYTRERHAQPVPSHLATASPPFSLRAIPKAQEGSCGREPGHHEMKA